jgi:hypothetical protein
MPLRRLFFASLTKAKGRSLDRPLRFFPCEEAYGFEGAIQTVPPAYLT